MRKILLPLLLASVAATPAFAQHSDRFDRQDVRSERQQSREDRQQSREDRRDSRPERSNDDDVRARSSDGPPSPGVAGGNRGSDGAVNAPAVGDATVRGGNRNNDAAKIERSARRDPGDGVRVGGGTGRQQQLTDDSTTQQQRQEIRNEAREQRDIRDNVRTPPKQSAAERQQAREQRNANREVRQAERPVPPVLRDRAPIVSRTPREGTQPPVRAEVRRSSPAKWSSNWRHSSKYDWYNWRKRHRWLFNLGFYNDPFGWGYRPYSIGWRMWPSYYSRNYWLSDPWEYRLPYAPPGYRWIRYYDDAVLIDTWDGRVVDVLYNFFW